MNPTVQILIAMVVYMAAVIVISVVYAKRANKNSEAYFLGERSLGPLMLFSLFWKRINKPGAIAGRRSYGLLLEARTR